MEEELLQDMIRDRETQIALIQRKMEEQLKKMDRLKNELGEVRSQLEPEVLKHRREIEDLHQKQNKCVKQYKETSEKLDMKKQQQGTQLHLYNEIMKAVASPESRDSSYVMRMQAQLCKAMHSMGMIESQLAMLRDEAETFPKYLKEEIASTVEEKSQVELKLMNELVVTDASRHEVEVKHKDMMDAFIKDKDTLLEKIEMQQEDPEEDDDEEEGDDEEEKEELQEILTQGREEMERMEEENRAQLEVLERVKQKVLETKGESFVEELVSSIAEEFKEEEESESEEEQ